MIRCICHAVTDQALNEAVEKGARTMEDIENACGAGTGCGICRDEIRAIVEKEDDHGRGRRSNPVRQGKA